MTSSAYRAWLVGGEVNLKKLEIDDINGQAISFSLGCNDGAGRSVAYSRVPLTVRSTNGVKK